MIEAASWCVDASYAEGSAWKEDLTEERMSIPGSVLRLREATWKKGR